MISKDFKSRVDARWRQKLTPKDVACASYAVMQVLVSNKTHDHFFRGWKIGFLVR